MTTMTTPSTLSSQACRPRWATPRSPERKTIGGRLAKVAAQLGQPLMPWQSQVANVAGELLPDGRPAYREVRVKVPRQSGKTTMILVVECDRSLFWGRRQHTLYACQDRNHSRAKWEEHWDMIQASKLAPLFRIRRMTGMEEISAPRTGSIIGITASTETAGHGNVLDLGVVDEAWSQIDERLAQGYRPAMMTRRQAQMWVVSTEGTDLSSFLNDRCEDGRQRVDDGCRDGVCYFEWSAEDGDDPDDPETWLRCMPAIGYTVGLETIQADHDALDAAEFSRAYLNRRAVSGRPVIDAADWTACRDPVSQVRGIPCFAVDTTPDRSHSSIGVAGWKADRHVHVEIVDHRPGTEWVAERCRELQSRWAAWPILIDPAGPAASLLLDLAANGVATDTVSARDYSSACGHFFDAIVEHTIAHLDQPVLNQAVAGARKRSLGDAWAWARKAGGDISPLVAVTLARWGLVKAGTGNAQIL